LKSGSRVESLATLDARRRAAPQRIQKLPRRMQRGGSFPNNQFDMSEADQVDGGIVIKDKRFDFETCEEIDLYGSNVRLLSLHDVA
jgi:hypothetical protein